MKILRSEFEHAEARHHNLSIIASLSQVYSSMTSSDAGRLGQVYALFDSLKTASHLDSEGFAGMLVSFVQNIPYSAVKDGNCDEDKDFTFSTLQEPQTGGCIGNVPYGVQSPVEFMVNFQGDCDTRTLFLFTFIPVPEIPVIR